MTDEVFPAIEQLMEKHGIDVTITDMVRLMGKWGMPFSTRDVSGIFWADVDTFEDYEAVAKLLSLNGRFIEEIGLSEEMDSAEFDKSASS